MTNVLPNDIIRLVSTYLKPTDIVNLGSCSRELFRKLLSGPDSEKLWRHYVSKVIAHRVPLTGISVNELNWKSLAFEKDVKNVHNLLRLKHIDHRLRELPSSKNFLQFYCRIDTIGSVPQRDLLGNIIPNETKDVKLPSSVFKLDIESLKETCQLDIKSRNIYERDDLELTFYPCSDKNQAFFWDGESGFKSTTIIYAVDRQRTPPNVMLCDKRGWLMNNLLLEARDGYIFDNDENPEVDIRFQRKNALGDTNDHFGRIHLVKKQLNANTAEIAGKLAHNDHQYFLNESEYNSYNYVDSHSSFRNLGNHESNYRIGSNTKKKTKVNGFLKVSQVTKIEVYMNLSLLYETFCKL